LNVRHRLVAAALGILVCPTLASPETAATSGKVTWLKQSFAISHAYAMKDPSTGWVELLLTQEPLAADVLNDRKNMAGLAKTGKLHALWLRLSKERAILATGIYNESHGLYNITGEDQVFTPTVFTDKRVEGTAQVGEGTELERTLMYDVRFAADISSGKYEAAK
jgi:hypothetical protein